MRPVSLFAWFGLVICTAAGAAIVTSTTHYRWRDVQGVIHFGDAIPPEAVPLGYDIVNDQGLVVRHVDRQKTPAEQKAAAAEAARQAQVKRVAQQQALADTQLLAAYPNEAELREAHDGKLAQMQQSIKTTQSNLRSQEQSLADLLARTAELEHGNEPVPPYLRKEIASQRQTVADERNDVVRMQNDRAETVKQFDAELLHYRALRAKEQSESADSGQ